MMHFITFVILLAQSLFFAAAMDDPPPHYSGMWWIYVATNALIMVTHAHAHRMRQ